MKPLLSAFGVVAAGSLMYLVKTYISDNQTIIQKQVLKQILVTLRKRVFSTLREIAFVVNNIKANQSDFQPKKISDIIMKDGGSGDIKLNLIEQLTIQSYNITRQSFEASCNFYKNNDYQIRVLLKNLSMDIQLALNGNIQDYNGPKICISPNKVIQIYRQILIRRMSNIKEKLIHGSSNQDCIKRQWMIQEYLQCQGIRHDKQPHQKIFISILQKNYREDADFRIQFQNLQIEMHDFMQQIEREQHQRHINKVNDKKKGQQQRQSDVLYDRI